jgi:hypothetical protein
MPPHASLAMPNVLDIFWGWRIVSFVDSLLQILASHAFFQSSRHREGNAATMGLVVYKLPK